MEIGFEETYSIARKGYHGAARRFREFPIWIRWRKSCKSSRALGHFAVPSLQGNLERIEFYLLACFGPKFCMYTKFKYKREINLEWVLL